MNTRHSTVIGLLLLTVAAIPGCLNSGKKDNSYLNMAQAEHAAGDHASGSHNGHNSAKPAGESQAAAGHEESAIEVAAKPANESSEGAKEPALSEKSEVAIEPKVEPIKAEVKKESTKPLSPAEKAKAAKLKQDEDAVEAVATKWMALITSGRSEAPKELLNLYTKDAVFIGADSAHVRERSEDIRSYFAYFTKLPELAVTGYQGNVRVYGDSAIETGSYTFTYKAGEKRETVPARFSIHYRRIDGEWKINSHHSSRLPEAAKPAKEG